MYRIFPIALTVLILLAGCQQVEQEEVSEALVEANAAYVEHFGPPPEVKSGRAYARVAYLPLLANPQQVAAVPLFLYREQGQLQQILDRLVSGELLTAEDSRFLAAFSGKVAIKELRQQGGALHLSVQRLAQQPLADPQALARALTETACQFEEIERVQLQLDGSPFPGQPAAGFSSQPELIAPLAKPQLMLAAGVWEADSGTPQELMISFDRPVSINSFRVLDERGEQVGGNYYASMFDMAVVIHPQRPEDFSPGTLLNVVWDVTDKLGRSNSGFSKLALQRFEHP